MDHMRTSNFPIEPLFLSRWSPRAYDAAVLPEHHLLTILEAGRWAPSAYNIQPWRFLYARRDDELWPDFLSVLDPFNRRWAADASALIFVLSDTVMPGDGDRPDAISHYNSFDAGAAWANIALQATALGYSAHAMAGLVFSEAPAVLRFPSRYKLEIGISIGRRAERDRLPADLRAGETPSDRMPLNRIAFPGRFPVTPETIAAQ
ncbi:MAG: nitroreductase family protein [Pseudomonadota bacterium]